MKERIHICSKENEKYKFALSLFKPKFRKKTESFLVEGLRAISQAEENQIPVEFVFVTEECLEKNHTRIESFRFVDRIFVLEENLYRDLSDTVHSQGIIAVCKKRERPVDQNANFLLILDRVQDPGNLGTLLRTALAYGVDRILLMKGSVDAFSPKVTRASMGANLCLPIDENVLPETIRELKKEGYTIYCAALSQDSLYYRSVQIEGKAALVLGNEANGIEDEILTCSDHNIVIPIKNEMESLNVSIAGAILINEFFYRLKQI